MILSGVGEASASASKTLLHQREKSREMCIIKKNESM